MQIRQLQSPPRVRVEWLIAGGRMVLATGTLIVMALPHGHSTGYEAMYLAAWYLVYSLALLALVWTPTRFAAGWDLVVHAVDVTVFALWTLFPDGGANPAFVFYLFAIVCAILRWQMTGALWTAAVAIAADLGTGVYGQDAAANGLTAVAADAVYLVVIAVFVAYVGTHHVRFQYEIGRLAAWPRTPVATRRELVEEILVRSSECLRSGRTLLVWEEPGEEWINVAWQTRTGIEHIQAPEGRFGSYVLPNLADSSFQTRDAGDERARVIILRATGFRRRRCKPVQEGLRAQFDMRAVRSWPLRGELVRGRLFCLDALRMRLDDLVLGEFVASLAVARLENFYWHGRMRDAAALEERVRLAREVHDHVLQAQAGTALQLLAARRVLADEPSQGLRLLSEVQDQMERDELEMRSFVAGLRPSSGHLMAPPVSLRQRLDVLRERVRRQWEIRVSIDLDSPEDLPTAVSESVYRLVQESVINAAKHADASVVRVSIGSAGEAVRILVSDDGRGFGFRGTYDLAELDKLGDGPVTLRERVAELGGDLVVTSSVTGADLMMTLPLARFQPELL